jgi:hypothetical protein
MFNVGGRKYSLEWTMENAHPKRMEKFYVESLPQLVVHKGQHS